MTAVRAWAAIVAIYGLGVMFAFTGTARPPYPLVGAVVVASAVVLAARQDQLAAALTAAAMMLCYQDAVKATMTVHLFWVSLALALFTGDALRLVLRVQVAAVYGFAAVNKLWPHFLSGDALAEIVPWFPAVGALAVAVIVCEAGLGVAVLARWRWAPVGVVALHLPIALFTGQHPLHVVTLLAYGAAMLWTVGVGLGRSDPVLVGDVCVDRAAVGATQR